MDEHAMMEMQMHQAQVQAAHHQQQQQQQNDAQAFLHAYLGQLDPQQRGSFLHQFQLLPPQMQMQQIQQLQAQTNPAYMQQMQAQQQAHHQQHQQQQHHQQQQQYMQQQPQPQQPNPQLQQYMQMMHGYGPNPGVMMPPPPPPQFQQMQQMALMQQQQQQQQQQAHHMAAQQHHHPPPPHMHPPVGGPAGIQPIVALVCDNDASGSSCHQCKTRRAVSDLYFCGTTHRKGSKSKKKKVKTQVCRKKFCTRCLIKFYSELPPRKPSNGGPLDWSCPGCRGLCSCAACRRGKVKEEPSDAHAHAHDDHHHADSDREAHTRAHESESESDIAAHHQNHPATKQEEHGEYAAAAAAAAHHPHQRRETPHSHGHTSHDSSHASSPATHSTSPPSDAGRRSVHEDHQADHLHLHQPASSFAHSPPTHDPSDSHHLQADDRDAHAALGVAVADHDSTPDHSPHHQSLQSHPPEPVSAH